jgi:hypothetical protein
LKAKPPHKFIHTSGKAEDAAKVELMQHPSPDTLPILLKSLPSSDATVQDNIIEILGAYNDIRKIPALISHWADLRSNRSYWN